MNPNIIQYQILRSPVLKAPSFMMLSPSGYYSKFVRSSFKGYSRELDAKYGFNAALEWYLESNAKAAVETNFLNSTTCLELLMDKLLSDKKLDMILNESDFKKFYESICTSSEEILRNMNKDKETINRVNNYTKTGSKTLFC